MDRIGPRSHTRGEEEPPRPGGHAADRRRQFEEERGLPDRPRTLDLDHADSQDGDEESGVPAGPGSDESSGDAEVTSN